MATTEIEKKCFLTKNEFEKIKVKYPEMKLITNYGRFSMVYVGKSGFNLNTEGKKDIRIKSDDGKIKLVVKLGSWHADAARTEHEVHLAYEELEDMISILKALGYFQGFITYYLREEYEYNGLTITFDAYQNTKGQSLMEVESTSDEEEKIDAFFKENNLTPIGSNEIQKFVADLMNEEGNQFDLEKDNVDEWIEAHRTFIQS